MSIFTGQRRMFVNPLFFNSLDTVCTQRVFTESAQSKASLIIILFVLCDSRKKVFYHFGPDPST